MDKIIGFARIGITVPDFGNMDETPDQNWQPHFNLRDYEGDWTVLALRSPAGTDTPIPLAMHNEDYTDTVHMVNFPSIKKLIDGLECEVMSARLLNLKAGAIIKQHRDLELAFEKGEARLHFVVQTNPKVEFYVNDVRVVMSPGECWYINANLPHRVANYGDTDRIHLVVDCVVNDWLRELMGRSEKTIFTEQIDVAQTLQMIKALREQRTETATRMADELEQKLLPATNGQ